METEKNQEIRRQTTQGWFLRAVVEIWIIILKKKHKNKLSKQFSGKMQPPKKLGPFIFPENKQYIPIGLAGVPLDVAAN